MLLLSCQDLARGFDEGPLFEEVGFELYAGDRVGLVGPNGVGKTTLLRLLANADQPDLGDVRYHAGARAELLQQEPDFIAGHSLFQEARRGLDELVTAHDDLLRTAEALANAVSDAERKPLAARYDRLNELLRRHDAYNVDHRIEEVLDGLGFDRSEYSRPVETFSGGQQRRLMLARLLLSAPDIMLLDEPSNHLDIRSTRWLEDYLVGQQEAMLIVSHDRYFLDRVVGKIFELNGGKLSVYPGNYQAYARLRKERHDQQLKAWEAQQEYIAQQEDYIRRVHYGQLHKQAQSRKKALERLERVEKPKRMETPQMHFGPVKRSGDLVLRVEGLTKAYDQPLFNDLAFTLTRGRRLGVMGPNGSGKTTLLRVLLGDEPPDAGNIEHGQQVQFGYYDQQLKSLRDDLPVIRAVWPDGDPLATDQARRDLLARFGLTGDQVYQPVHSLSGGERSRAALARLVAQGVNVLVLDEPTNHLDLWARESLEESLSGFEGTVIVVSHDRYFLNRVVDLLIVLDGDGRAELIHGNYDTYERMSSIRETPSDARKPEAEPVVTTANRGGSSTARRPKRRFPYRKADELEAEILREENKLKDLEQLLASPDLYRDGEKVKQTTSAFEDAKALLARLYEHWEEAVELN